MPNDLRDFVSHLAGTMTLTLATVVLTAFLTLPATFHGHSADQPADAHPASGHMT